MSFRGVTYLDNLFNIAYECKNKETPNFPSRITMTVIAMGDTDIELVCETCNDISPFRFEIGIELELCVSSLSPSTVTIYAV